MSKFVKLNGYHLKYKRKIVKNTKLNIFTCLTGEGVRCLVLMFIKAVSEMSSKNLSELGVVAILRFLLAGCCLPCPASLKRPVMACLMRAVTPLVGALRFGPSINNSLYE